ncbi:MAG: glycosyltransferase [Nanoarchaeota archaeon]|nr:glycosyltransferase [Nanoarchaeota archaeon]
MFNEIKMKTKITVIIPTKNEEKFIGPCLRALKAQEIKPEIIIVDGYSTDNTIKIAKKYTNKILFEKNKGIAYARNLGWKHASGEIIAYCDADSRPKKDWTKKILKHMNGNLCISGPIKSYDGSKKVKRDLRLITYHIYGFLDKINYTCITGPNMAFPKHVLKAHPFKTDLIEDFEIGNRLRKYGKVKFFKDMIMPISARRYEKSFYRMAFKHYILNFIRIKLNMKTKTSGYW